MIKVKFNIFMNLICILTILALNAEDFYADIPVYKELSSLTSPTNEDLHKVQRYMTYGERSIIKYLNDYEPNARNLKIIGNLSEEQPERGDIVVNCDKDDRENCLICYSSFNKNYPRGLKRLVEFIRKSDFKGHIIYRLGGWPDISGGSLTLAHVPYAFKVSFFKEVKSLGFKRAFWLDTAILPVVSLNLLFNMIKENGYFAMGNSHNIGPYTNSFVWNAFGITSKEADNIPSCSAGIIGLDFTTKIGNTIFEKWYA